ncbi:hypothetical protein ACRALDRAFT_213011 [Sodiomyces alcalophilus JCM 7366]|uniref:uncharacterized protein n=1 Tax=Sodiomyces alcalophilus JCM 7366 TaxID=591952 RepID=UPI0039B6BB05
MNLPNRLNKATRPRVMATHLHRELDISKHHTGSYVQGLDRSISFVLSSLFSLLPLFDICHITPARCEGCLFTNTTYSRRQPPCLGVCTYNVVLTRTKRGSQLRESTIAEGYQHTLRRNYLVHTNNAHDGVACQNKPLERLTEASNGFMSGADMRGFLEGGPEGIDMGCGIGDQRKAGQTRGTHGVKVSLEGSDNYDIVYISEADAIKDTTSNDAAERPDEISMRKYWSRPSVKCFHKGKAALRNGIAPVSRQFFHKTSPQHADAMPSRQYTVQGDATFGLPLAMTKYTEAILLVPAYLYSTDLENFSWRGGPAMGTPKWTSILWLKLRVSYTGYIVCTGRGAMMISSVPSGEDWHAAVWLDPLHPEPCQPDDCAKSDIRYPIEGGLMNRVTSGSLGFDSQASQEPYIFPEQLDSSPQRAFPRVRNHLKSQVQREHPEQPAIHYNVPPTYVGRTKYLRCIPGCYVSTDLILVLRLRKYIVTRYLCTYRFPKRYGGREPGEKYCPRKDRPEEDEEDGRAESMYVVRCTWLTGRDGKPGERHDRASRYKSCLEVKMGTASTGSAGTLYANPQEREKDRPVITSYLMKIIKDREGQGSVISKGRVPTVLSEKKDALRILRISREQINEGFSATDARKKKESKTNPGLRRWNGFCGTPTAITNIQVVTTIASHLRRILMVPDGISRDGNVGNPRATGERVPREQDLGRAQSPARQILYLGSPRTDLDSIQNDGSSSYEIHDMEKARGPELPGQGQAKGHIGRDTGQGKCEYKPQPSTPWYEIATATTGDLEVLALSAGRNVCGPLDFPNSLRHAAVFELLEGAFWSYRPYNDGCGLFTTWFSSDSRYWTSREPYRSGLLSFEVEGGAKSLLGTTTRTVYKEGTVLL